MNSANQTMFDVLCECYGKVCYSHKTHEKAKEINQLAVEIVKISNVVFLSLTTYFSVMSLGPESKFNTISSIVCSTITLMFLVAQLSFRPEEWAQKHKLTADKLWQIRERYLNLIADVKMASVSADELKQKRDALTVELGKIYDDAPTTGFLHYFLAKRALKVTGESTFTKNEIDNLLPPSLRS